MVSEHSRGQQCLFFAVRAGKAFLDAMIVVLLLPQCQLCFLHGIHFQHAYIWTNLKVKMTQQLPLYLIWGACEELFGIEKSGLTSFSAPEGTGCMRSLDSTVL